MSVRPPPWLATVAALLASGCGPDQPDVDWPHYLGDLGRSHFSELAGIDRANVAELGLAWRYDAGDLQPGVSAMDTTPLVVDGVLYGLTPTLDAFALDAATGEELWRYRSDNASSCSQRGLLWHDDVRGDSTKARLFFTACAELVALDPSTGVPDAAFGAEGRLDLSALVGGIALREVEPGTVAGELVVFGLRDATDRPGDSAVVALSARNGRLAWRYPALDADRQATPADGMDDFAPAGAMAFDAARDTLFVPMEWHLVALDASAGTERWRRAVVGTGEWLSSQTVAAPTLVTVGRQGFAVEAVAVATRSGRLHIFARDTGEPLVGAAGVRLIPGAFRPSDRSPGVMEEIGLLVAAMEHAPGGPPPPAGRLMFPGIGAGVGWGGVAYQRGANRLLVNVQETASVLRSIEIPAGFSERDIYIAHCARCHGPEREGLYEDRPERYGAGGPSLIGVGERLSISDIRTVIERGRGSMPAFENLSELERFALESHLLSDPGDADAEAGSAEARSVQAPPVTLRDVDGLPGNAPPWGLLLAIDLDALGVAWQVPLGEYLAHPGLGFGAENVGGPLVTASGLVFVAATPDLKFRAFDAADGQVLWEADLPAGGYSTPIAYRADGREFVAIAAGGGRLGPPSGADYLAFALPP